MARPDIPLAPGGKPCPPVVVLLPVFNGQAFLEPLLDSVLGQSIDVCILCRDDGSSDGSADIIRSYAQHHQGRIHLLEDDLGNLGACGSFAMLMQFAADTHFLRSCFGIDRSVAVALCDQDDVWHPDKLSVCLAHLAELEALHPGAPCLVHSDLRLVGQDGAEIAPSMARYQGLRVGRHSLTAQLLSNTVTGCTAVMNQALLRVALPIPSAAIMHDWWLSIVCSAVGVRRYLDTPLIDYRQHATNTIGAKARENVSRLRRFSIQRFLDNRHHEIFQLNARQARALMHHANCRLSQWQRLGCLMVTWLRFPVPPFQRLLYRILRRL